MYEYFKADDFFMLRAPLYSIDFYKELFHKAMDTEEKYIHLNAAAEDDIFREALFIATHDLSTMLQKQQDEHKELSEALLNSIAKYLIRTSTRPTPYGLFSGISICDFSETSHMCIDDIKAHIKRARVDVEWLCGVISQIESNEDIFKSLRVKFNSQCYINGDRIINPYLTQCGLADKNRNDILTAVRYTKQVEYVKNFSKDFISVEQLVRLMSEENPNTAPEKIYQFIKSLFKSEYLLSELRIPLIDTDELDYVKEILAHVEGASNYYQAITHIQTMLLTYNSMPIGSGRLVYEEIREEMKSLYESDNYIQVDLKTSLSARTLSTNVATEIEKVVNMLLRIYPMEAELKNISDYKENFLEKYGYFTEVPILELFDENTGLGAPSGYTSPESFRPQKYRPDTEETKQLYKLIQNKIINALKCGECEIKLEDDDIKKITKDRPDIDENIIPISMEVFMEVIAKEQQSIDEDDFLLCFSGAYASSGAGKTFGRFTDMLTDTPINEKIYQRESALTEEDTIFAELHELPRSSRLCNVAMNTNCIEYQIAMATNQSSTKTTIDITDIYIGLNSKTNHFYVKSKSLNKKIYVKTTNMLNYLFGSNIYRFLREIFSLCYINIADAIHSLDIKDFMYYPRITYSKTVLQKARWKISRPTLEIETKDKQQIKEKFCEWSRKWNVPRFVYYEVSDNKLLLDLENEIHLNLLLEVLSKSREEIILTETLHNLEELWLKDKSGRRYCNEIVVPLYRRHPVAQSKPEHLFDDFLPLKHVNEPRSHKITGVEAGSNRLLLPGNENWIYFKLYGISRRVDEMVGEEVYAFCDRLKQDGIISKHFFIRYSDPEEHIRLRLQGAKDKDILTYMPIFGEWFLTLRKRGLLSQVVIDTYERELERYGGIDVIEAAENFFYEDSLFVEKLMLYKRTKELTLKDEYIGIASLVSVMRGFGLEFDMQEQWLSAMIKPSSYRDEFKKESSQCRRMTVAFAEDATQEEHLLAELLRGREKAVHRMKQIIDSADKNGTLTNTKDSILSSCIHMFCNRLKADNTWEEKVRALTRHSLYAQLQYKKAQAGKKNGNTK